MGESDHWFVDGTFKSTPPLFYQVYTILAKRFGGVHPIVYALLPNKTESTYTNMLDLLKTSSDIDLSPSTISCDFEVAAINAFKKAFPTANIDGCLFHLTKNVKKKLGEFHLLSRYKNEPDFAIQVRMMTSLAFLKIEDLDEAVELLYQELPEELHELLEWFEHYYLGNHTRNGNTRRGPSFTPQTWSVYERVLSNTDRTNNFAEAAHRRLQSELGMDHPSVWKFINTLKKIQHGRDIFYEKLLAGFDPPKKLKRYRDADNRILKLVTEYTTTRNFMQYLKAISYNYEMET